jgi:hypothetical protein
MTRTTFIVATVVGSPMPVGHWPNGPAWLAAKAGEAQQADDQGRPPAAVSHGHQKAAGGDAGEGESRLITARA